MLKLSLNSSYSPAQYGTARTIAARILQQEEGSSRMFGVISETCKSSLLRFWFRAIPYAMHYQSCADQI